MTDFLLGMTNNQWLGGCLQKYQDWHKMSLLQPMQIVLQKNGPVLQRICNQTKIRRDVCHSCREKEVNRHGVEGHEDVYRSGEGQLDQ
jgi:hypothetical protein